MQHGIDGTGLNRFYGPATENRMSEHDDRASIDSSWEGAQQRPGQSCLATRSACSRTPRQISPSSSPQSFALRCLVRRIVVVTDTFLLL
jgi:hypothetical protein